MKVSLIISVLALSLLLQSCCSASGKNINTKKEKKMEVTGKTIMGGNPLSLVGNRVAVGDIAQDFTLTNKDMGEVKLSDYKGKIVVLSIFPSIDTPVCATQTRTFNKKAVDLGSDIVILAISKDLPFALSRFCGAEGIDKVHALSDYKANDFGLKYGFLINELQLLSRGVVVIDKNGKIAYVEYVSEVKDEPNYDKALEVIEKIK